MFKTSLLLFSVPAVLSIIVTDPPPSEGDYRYSYDIEDPRTGDMKSQHEVKTGDVVTGAYSLVSPDGTKRIVEYTADSKNGFKAVVRDEPITEQLGQTQQKPQNFRLDPTAQGPQVFSDSQSMQEVPRQYINDGSPQEPNAYNLVQVNLPIPYAKNNHDIIYFTPANEIQSDTINFVSGKYFEPANE